MAIVEDPEGHEASLLHAMIDFRAARVLEVGCGEGRLTWRYADKAPSVMAIDPDGEDIERAWVSVPEDHLGILPIASSIQYVGVAAGRTACGPPPLSWNSAAWQPPQTAQDPRLDQRQGGPPPTSWNRVAYRKRRDSSMRQ